MGRHPLEPKPDDPLLLGERRDEPGEPVTMPVAALLRHVMALGSSGSGKTVFCKVLVEEAALRGVPVIAIDPQGDLASLALALATEPGAAVAADADPDDTHPDGEASGSATAELHEDTMVDQWAGVDSMPGASARQKRRAPALHDRVEVVVFTPASRRGIQLSADPVEAEAVNLPHAARVRAFTRTAGRIVSLLGYDLDGDEGAGLLAVFDRCLNEMADEGQPATSLRSVTERLEKMGPKIQRYSRYLDERKIRSACQRAARLDVGARRLLFHDGVPIDIDVLLGRSPSAPPEPGKTRISVIYLNTLEAQEDKDFVVATLADRLVSWMLQNPSPTLQAVLYIDEVAPYMPPVRKPACKEDLQVLFKQARKFGVGCVVATQNPGDVDYKAMGQFGTWALGRLATRQDLKKVEPAVRSLMPGATPLLDEVPSLRPGELVLLSPDNFDEPCQLATRWLHSEHRTLDEEKIDELVEPWRARFAELERGGGSDTRLRRVAVPIELDETMMADSGPITAVPAGAASRAPAGPGAGPAMKPPPPPPPGQKGAPAAAEIDPDQTTQWARSTVPATVKEAETRARGGEAERAASPARGRGRARGRARVGDRARDRARDRSRERARARPANAAGTRTPVTRSASTRAAGARAANRTADRTADRAADRTAPDRARERIPTRNQDRPPVPDGHPERARRPDSGHASMPEQPPGRARSGEPDPSWAWPRDPDLAWIRARSAEPAWAPSTSPPSASVPPGELAGEHDDSSGSEPSEAAPRALPSGRVPDDTDDRVQRQVLILASKLSMTVPEFADRAGIAERTARAKLKALVASGHAGQFREERTVRFWARTTGARPDLGMKASVLSVQPRVDHGAAEEIGRSLVKSKVLGLLGADERFAQARLVYRLVYRVAFQEKVKRTLIGRIIGPSHEERLGSLYLHARTLDVLLFSLEGGIRFATRLPDHASEVDDLDGVVTFLEIRPGDITFDEEEWLERCPPALARKRLRETFGARPGAVTPVFVPLWKLLLRRGTGESYRVETIDALSGWPVDWPDPG